MNTFENKLCEMWSFASQPTADEPLCRARWGVVMKTLTHLEDSASEDAPWPWWHADMLRTVWGVAAFHRFDYSVDPPGYTGRGAR